MAVAALDTYMHRLVVERAFQHDELPSDLARLSVSFEQLLAQADLTKGAARASPHNSRPRVQVKRALRDRLLRETFQNSDSVGRALAMAGRRREWRAIGLRMNPPASAERLQQRLDTIVQRRNQIVHEGDYVRQERPRRAVRNVLLYSQAKDDIDFIAELIEAIHSA
jgi:hypothetical protein